LLVAFCGIADFFLGFCSAFSTGNTASLSVSIRRFLPVLNLLGIVVVVGNKVGVSAAHGE